MDLEIVNPNAAGIDVGSRSHFVAKGQQTDDVREFGVCASDHEELISWLKKYEIKTIAMESTGSYWQNLFSALQGAGFEVLLVNGKFTKNIKGKKTDVQDCQWIQKLHSLGLLSGSFLPDETTEHLRTLCRHRSNLMDMAASTSKKMQKYLRLMNLRLDIVVKDICGLTGLQIIETICQGESDSKVLASFRHGNCRKTESEISKALHSNGRKDYLFALQHEYQMYNELQAKIIQCKHKVKEQLESTLKDQRQTEKLKTTDKIHKRINKNAPKSIDLNQVAFKYFGGVDLMDIEGISHSTILTMMSEVGPRGLLKFPTGKHFASWLILAPNNKMRKLSLFIATSLDGYIAKPNDDLSFLKFVEKEGEDYGYAEFTANIDTIILGRKTYDYVIKEIGSSYYDNGQRDVYVISRTARPSVGRTIFYTGKLNELVQQLKYESGKNIYCDGGAEIINELIQYDLIDEFIISIIPTLVGNGTRLFKDNRPEQQLEFVSAKSFETGLMQLHYKRKRQSEQ